MEGHEIFQKKWWKIPQYPSPTPPPAPIENLPYLTFILTDWPDLPHRNENFIFNQNYQTLLIVCTKMVFHQISWKKPISLSEWPVWQWFGQPVWPKESTPSFCIREVLLSIYLSILGTAALIWEVYPIPVCWPWQVRDPALKEKTGVTL